MLWLMLPLGCADGDDTPADSDGDAAESADADSEDDVDSGADGDGDVDVDDGGDPDPDGDGSDKPDPIDGDGEPLDGDDDGLPDGDPDDPDGDQDAPDGDEPLPDPVVISDVVITENPNNVLSFFVQWTTDPVATTILNVTCGDDHEAILSSGMPSAKHRVFVMGLYDGADCDFKISGVSNAGGTGEHTEQVNVGPLPRYLPEFTVEVRDEDAIQPGWTLFNLNNHFDSQPLMLAVVDSLGRYRWYMRLATTGYGSDSDVRSIDGGIMVGGNHGLVDPQIVDWQGNVLWTEEFRMHHAMRPWGDNQVMYLNGEKSCSGGDWEGYESISSDAVYIWDMDQRQVVWSWVLCHHYTPPTIQTDWSHINAIVPFPDENALLISSRNQHALFKIDLDTEDIVWKLGLGGDFFISPDEQFYRQHAPEIQSNGNILLFDNGHATERGYSRVIEFSYDDTPGLMAFDIVWSYTPSPYIFTSIWGDADRLANGNTLATFGHRSTTEKSHIIEVDDKAEPDEVWDLVLPLKWGVYRSERIVNPLLGEILPADAD